MKEAVIAFSKAINIDKIGFTSAKKISDLVPHLRKRDQLGYATEFESKNFEKRVDPELTLPNARSIVVIALAYPSRMLTPPKGTKREPRGMFARSSWGEDYHVVLRNKLKQLEQFIIKHNYNEQCHVTVDTGPLVERAVALRAGVGWLGKNGLLITDEFGSYVYLGLLLTTVFFPEDGPLPSRCGNCVKCLEQCPTNAFIASAQINSRKCLSYITQTKGEVPPHMRMKLGNRLFGCDTCQVVCPYNYGLNSNHHEEFIPSGVVEKPKLSSLLFLSNRQFSNSYGHLAGSWRGRTPIQRNAIIALVFYRSYEAIPALLQLTSDQRPVIRNTALWAINQLQLEKNEKIILKNI